MSAWDLAFEDEITAVIARLVAAPSPDAQTTAWRALMVKLAPHLEAWARASRVLRRCRLANDDDARGVMVEVFERLAADHHANLRAFMARSPAPAAPPADDVIAELVRLGRLDEDEDIPVDAHDGTPLRAWLLRLLDFVAHDHVRRRLGWSAVPGEPTKRDLHTDAATLDAAAEPHTPRPPMTDRLTVAKLVTELHAHIATFPEDMRAALALWLDDLDPPAIAARLQLADAGRARSLVRAGQARLRERFRGRSPLLFA